MCAFRIPCASPGSRHLDVPLNSRTPRPSDPRTSAKSAAAALPHSLFCLQLFAFYLVYKVPYVLPSDYPMRIVILSERSESKDLSSTIGTAPAPHLQPTYKVPYTLPSSVCPNPFVFTLFTKLPRWGGILPKSERPSRVALPSFPASTTVGCGDSFFFTDRWSLV